MTDNNAHEEWKRNPNPHNLKVGDQVMNSHMDEGVITDIDHNGETCGYTIERCGPGSSRYPDRSMFVGQHMLGFLNKLVPGLRNPGAC